jgi:hypothetical protein
MSKEGSGRLSDAMKQSAREFTAAEIARLE